MKEVLITGGSSGIGAATAVHFSERGWMVHLLGRDLEKLKGVQKKLKNTSEIYSCDLADAKNIKTLAADLKSKNANISVLVNNAGIYRPSEFANESEDHWSWHFATNLFGPLLLTRLLWPQLVANKGCVTNVSSTLGLRPIAGAGAYSATKAAMDNWTQTLALEGGPLGVRANAICPGLVDTPIHGFHKSDRAELQALRKSLNTLQPLGRLGEPEDIASAIYFVSSEEAAWMTGSIVPVDGGVTLTTKDAERPKKI